MKYRQRGRAAAPVRSFAMALVITAIIGGGVYAATNTFVSREAEVGISTGNATTVSDTSASGGNGIRFGGASGFQANCIVMPSDCGYPDATNTGVPAGVTLTNNGAAAMTITTNGAVVENFSLTNGYIVVNANNVTIRNCRITTYAYYPIENNGTNLTVENCEITGTEPTVTAAISFGNYTARRLNVSGSADGFKANANAIIEDCYIHDLRTSSGSHNDGVQTTGGNNVTIRHNTIDTNTAGVAVQFGGNNSGWLVTNNLIRATGWALNGEPGTTGSTITNNRFAPVAGWYGPYSFSGSGNTISGNYRDDTGAAV